MKEGSEVPRRGQIAKRDVLPDPLYNSKLVTRLINSVMYDGKKGVAQKIVYDAFEIINQKTGKEPLEVFQNAMENVMPVLEVKARRVGGSTYQVPIEVRPERRQTLGLRWITCAHGANSVSRYSSVMTRGDLTVVPSHFLAGFLKAHYGLADEKIRELTDGKNVVKVIAVPGKLVNIVVK